MTGYKVDFFAEKWKINYARAKRFKTRVTFESHNFSVLKMITKSIFYSRLNFLSSDFFTLQLLIKP